MIYDAILFNVLIIYTVVIYLYFTRIEYFMLQEGDLIRTSSA